MASHNIALRLNMQELFAETILLKKGIFDFCPLGPELLYRGQVRQQCCDILFNRLLTNIFCFTSL